MKYEFKETQAFLKIFLELLLWVGIWGVFDTLVKLIDNDIIEIVVYTIILIIASALYYLANDKTFHQNPKLFKKLESLSQSIVDLNNEIKKK